jgi:carboxynorspermidine decarboxylase
MSQITDELLKNLPTSPLWIVEEALLERNLKLLKYIKDEAGIEILLALKGFALWHTFEMVSKYLDGCCASGLNEAILSNSRFKKQTHTYSPAFKESEIVDIAKISNHIVFNSPNQLKQFRDLAREANPKISIGIRVNPEISVASAEIYNPCGAFSRLGTLKNDLDDEVVSLVDGFHLHALCEQGSDAFEEVLEVFEVKFGRYLKSLDWVNFGGGHLITKEGYDVERFIRVIREFKQRYPNLKVFIEPGEAIGWQTGVLVATVLDTLYNKMDIAILDTSSEAHMPDSVIMPYRVDVRGAKKPFEKPFTYKLTGNTCLAGDVMGDYSFDERLKIGDRVIFEDQIHYTMVKATTFNGIELPSIAILQKDGTLKVVRNFNYSDFESRLG